MGDLRLGDRPCESDCHAGLKLVERLANDPLLDDCPAWRVYGLLPDDWSTTMRVSEQAATLPKSGQRTLQLLKLSWARLLKRKLQMRNARFTDNLCEHLSEVVLVGETVVVLEDVVGHPVGV